MKGKQTTLSMAGFDRFARPTDACAGPTGSGATRDAVRIARLIAPSYAEIERDSVLLLAFDRPLK